MSGQAASTLVSVDLDDAACYHAIHGLPAPTGAQVGVGLTRWLPRFLELFESLGVRATFFVIGRDLARDLDAEEEGARWLRQALAQGHELGNHSYAHAYDLVRWSQQEQSADLRRCHELLQSLGAEPVGFRAPGYTHDERMLATVAALGYRYDSSSLPSPLYYLAKVGVMGLMALRGKRSSSMARGAASFFGRRTPHARADVDLWELPMSVSPWLRLPLIGTSLLASPSWLAASLRAAARRASYFHLELHGIDLADPERDPIAASLCQRQPELRVPFAVRRERLAGLLSARGGGFPCRDAVPD